MTMAIEDGAVEPLEVKYRPTDAELEACVELGRQVARRVKAGGE